MRILREYPYFFANVPFLLLPPILSLTRRHTLSRGALFSGILCMPCGALSLAHVGYWRPLRLAGGNLGLEDLVFAFAAGVLVWLAAAWPFRHTLPRLFVLPARGRPILLSGAAGGVLLVGLCRFGMDPMGATLAVGGLVFIGLLVCRPRLWPLALSGVLCFVPLYLAIVRIQLALWPAYIGQWNPNSPWAAVTVLGVPVGEVAWAVVFAAFWPPLIAALLGLERRGRGFAPA